MMKRLYHGVVLLAMIHLFAIAGFVAYLLASGRLDNLLSCWAAVDGRTAT